eukprot:TRINITY_DN43330_c0_g1_i1.p1 TRINITY_DN43330_c0_g1~~TRINITY_DN43330_c0_g1_i1.p1  ORF type:complete len:535 (-),score=67.46 TRINITY_DN43330_c0_g1_i1:112-1716(-)
MSEVALHSGLSLDDAIQLLRERQTAIIQPTLSRAGILAPLDSPDSNALANASRRSVTGGASRCSVKTDCFVLSATTRPASAAQETRSRRSLQISSVSDPSRPSSALHARGLSKHISLASKLSPSHTKRFTQMWRSSEDERRNMLGSKQKPRAIVAWAMTDSANKAIAANPGDVTIWAIDDEENQVIARMPDTPISAKLNAPAFVMKVPKDPQPPSLQKMAWELDLSWNSLKEKLADIFEPLHYGVAAFALKEAIGVFRRYAESSGKEDSSKAVLSMDDFQEILLQTCPGVDVTAEFVANTFNMALGWSTPVQACTGTHSCSTKLVSRPACAPSWFSKASLHNGNENVEVYFDADAVPTEQTCNHPECVACREGTYGSCRDTNIDMKQFALWYSSFVFPELRDLTPVERETRCLARVLGVDQSDVQKMRMIFLRYDIRFDGHLDKGEWFRLRDDLEKAMASEWQGRRSRRRPGAFSVVDTSGDGSIDFEEFCMFYNKLCTADPAAHNLFRALYPSLNIDGHFARSQRVRQRGHAK